MPTVLRIGAYRVVVYPNDHRPAHVHVIGNGCEAAFNLNCPDGPPDPRENFGFALQELTEIQRDIQTNLVLLCIKWGEIHGQP